MVYSKEEQKKNRAKLVEDLRSRQHKQTRGQLFDGEGYCCLGRACYIYSKECGCGQFILDDNEWFFSLNGASLKTYPNSSVADYFGFSTNSGSFIDKCGIKSCLSWMNDHGATFEEIANIIESEPEGLVQ